MQSIFRSFFKRKSAKSSQFDSLILEANRAVTNQNFDRAVELFDQAISVNHSSAEVFYKRGNALRNIGRLDDAVVSYSRAIELKPDYAHAYCNRGVVEQRIGLKADALRSYDRGIAIDPADPVTHYNRALLMQDISQWPEAVLSYDKALAANPDFADAKYNRSLALLFLGDFKNGWRDYEWRWKNAQRLAIGQPRDFAEPLWLGEQSISGKTILLWCEGGLGDTLQFCRYTSLVAARGATVILEAQPALIDLLRNLDGVSQVVAKGANPPPLDYQCPLMSLPLAFKTTISTIPAPRSYLRINETSIKHCKALLGERTRPRVGLVWSGNPDNRIDDRRSIQLKDWLVNLPPDFEYFCLQRDIKPADRAVLDSSTMIVSFTPDQLGFVATAALCACLDVVVSVDTSVAHLSAALGQRTWILLPFIPDWRWMDKRGDCPWYPTARLYRQKISGDWRDVFESVAADLRSQLSEIRNTDFPEK